MKNKNADAVLEQFWAEKSWDNFLPVLKELDGLIRRRVSFVRRQLEKYEGVDELVSRIQIFLYDKIGEYRPGGLMGISVYVDQAIIFHLKNTLTTYERRNKIVSYASAFSESDYAKKHVDGNCLYRLIDQVKDELSDESREFVAYLLQDQQTIHSVISLLETKRVKTRRPRYYEVIRGRFEKLKEEIQTLVLQKNLQIS